MKYVYPAVFTPEEKGQFSVYFPDLEGCYTSGDNLGDAIYMAGDVLAMTLVSYEDKGLSIPVPSEKLPLEEGEFQNYIACDTEIYRRQNLNKSVKKTLTIPEWLNEKALAQGINFSQVLQEALMERIGG
ncbi:type II toxin-antitoxin system HicB family antitoxin [Oribacterium sinus]|uniref:Type II toxin-antitoxin system HicB family antitoxin n=1 Tax=Oribacterium sinus TaxID=237576 RepID=A0A930DL51_9FIRM|nr:type II toxin-antitoxin system HicB family antitoxin [Oribacterium sinus]MBF1273184.1 type II toxin-antitoxin system HicB family antitoxin [Oribacterium sinus]